jgi:hypothetical protein
MYISDVVPVHQSGVLTEESGPEATIASPRTDPDESGRNRDREVFGFRHCAL